MILKDDTALWSLLFQARVCLCGLSAYQIVLCISSPVTSLGSRQTEVQRHWAMSTSRHFTPKNHITKSCIFIQYLFLSVFGATAPPPQWAKVSSLMRFLDQTQRRITVGRTPLDEWSARRRDLYLTTHNTHNRQTSMPPVGFEPTISAGERPQTYALDRAATGTGSIPVRLVKEISLLGLSQWRLCRLHLTSSRVRHLLVSDRRKLRGRVLGRLPMPQLYTAFVHVCTARHH